MGPTGERRGKTRKRNLFALFFWQRGNPTPRSVQYGRNIIPLVLHPVGALHSHRIFIGVRPIGGKNQDHRVIGFAEFMVSVISDAFSSLKRQGISSSISSIAQGTWGETAPAGAFHLGQPRRGWSLLSVGLAFYGSFLWANGLNPWGRIFPCDCTREKPFPEVQGERPGSGRKKDEFLEGNAFPLEGV